MNSRARNLFLRHARPWIALAAAVILVAMIGIAQSSIWSWQRSVDSPQHMAKATVISNQSGNIKLRFRDNRGSLVESNVKSRELPIISGIPLFGLADKKAKQAQSSRVGESITVYYTDGKPASFKLYADGAYSSPLQSLIRTSSLVLLLLILVGGVILAQKYMQMRDALRTVGKFMSVEFVDIRPARFGSRVGVAAIPDVDGSFIRYLRINTSVLGVRAELLKNGKYEVFLHPVNGSIAVIDTGEGLILCSGSARVDYVTDKAKSWKSVKPISTTSVRRQALATRTLPALYGSVFVLLFASLLFLDLNTSFNLHKSVNPANLKIGVKVDRLLAAMKPVAADVNVKVVDSTSLAYADSTASKQAYSDLSIRAQHWLPASAGDVIRREYARAPSLLATSDLPAAAVSSTQYECAVEEWVRRSGTEASSSRGSIGVGVCKYPSSQEALAHLDAYVRSISSMAQTVSRGDFPNSLTVSKGNSGAIQMHQLAAQYGSYVVWSSVSLDDGDAALQLAQWLLKQQRLAFESPQPLYALVADYHQSQY